MSFISKALVLNIVYLSVFSMLGVITRSFLQKFFLLGCNGAWGPCLSYGGLLFKDLISNMLGSYIIGVFAVPSAIGLLNDKSVAILNQDHPWQKNLHLQVGVRTGFCGSLTTFSSLMVDAMTGAINNNTWVQAVIEIFIGISCSIFTYTMGMHTVLYVDRYFLKSTEDVLQAQDEYKKVELDAYRSGSFLLSPDQMRLHENEPDVPRNAPSFNQRSSSGRILSTKMPSLFTTKMPSLKEEGQGEDIDAENGVGVSTAVDGIENSSMSRRKTKERHDANEEYVQREGSEIVQLAAPLVEKEPPFLTKTDCFMVCMLVLMIIGFVIGVIYEKQHTWIRGILLSALMGPFGCTLRWYLSRFNYKLPGEAAWFPIGTFTANMLATATSLAMAVLLAKLNGLSMWSTLVIKAVQSGVCGALSTVSTFVTEIVKFAEFIPDNARTYLYVAYTVGGAMLLSFIEYGWVSWA